MNEIEKDQLCQSTVQCLNRVNGSLTNFPGLLRRIIEEKAWEKRIHGSRVIELANLRELITKEPVDGWGEDPKRIEAIIKDSPEVLTLYRGAMKQKQGARNDLPDIIREVEESAHDTAKSYTLDRLKREAPELYSEVCDEKLSANAAAIKAGFRHKTATVRLDDARAAAKTLLKHYSKTELIEAIQLTTKSTK